MKSDVALSLLPVGLGGVALARAVYEDAAVARRGRGPGDSTTDAVAALSALALYLLSLEAPSDVAARGVLVASAAVAGVLWLAGRASDDGRLRPLFLFAAGLVAGTGPLVAIALVPLVAAALWAYATSPGQDQGALARSRLFLGATLVGAAGGLVGAVASSACGLGGWRALPTPSAAAAWSWLAGAARGVGTAGVAFALAGLVLGLLSSPRRRALAAVGVLLVGGEAARGAVGPVTSVGLALGAGLSLLDAGERLADAGLRGSAFMLAPLVMLVLVEPISVRASAVQLRAPDFGPVPPREPRARPIDVRPWPKR